MNLCKKRPVPQNVSSVQKCMVAKLVFLGSSVFLKFCIFRDFSYNSRKNTKNTIWIFLLQSTDFWSRINYDFQAQICL